MNSSAPVGDPARQPWWTWGLALAWLLGLAAVPWWLGLPLLLALVALLLVLPERLAGQADTLRRALRWGLPGMLFAVQRGLGGDALAWAEALLGALVGFTLLAGLESWLDRALARPALRPAEPSPEWSELARAPVGPVAVIIELAPPQWHDAPRLPAPPRPGSVGWETAGLPKASRLRVDGQAIDAIQPRCCFSPDGRWVAAPLAGRRGTVLFERDRQRLHRLRGWQLCGWHASQPWLARGEQDAPVALKDVLGQAADGAASDASDA